jgi:hypothetical protein
MNRLRSLIKGNGYYDLEAAQMLLCRHNNVNPNKTEILFTFLSDYWGWLSLDDKICIRSFAVCDDFGNLVRVE